MSIVISPSWLWSFTSCPYKYINSIYDATPIATAHWNLANAASQCWLIKTKNKLWPWLRYYERIINSRLEKKKQLDISILKKWMFNLFQFFNELSQWDVQTFQEMKLEFPLDGTDDIWLSWQPDVIVLYNKPDWDVCWEVIDIKCGKDSRYASDEIWRENSQRWVYPRFMFQHFDEEIKEMWITNPKIKFSFLVMDKWTWDVNKHSKIVDFRFVDLQVKTWVDEFIKYKSSDIPKDQYPAKECRACAFCDFKDSCPMTKALDKQQEIIDELF